MILVTSAIIAILFREPEALKMLDAVTQSGSRGVGAPTLVEAGAVSFARRDEAGPKLHRVIQEFSVTVVAFGEPYWQVAVLAYER